MNSFFTSSGRANLILLCTVFLLFSPRSFSQKKIFYIHDRDTKIQSAKINGSNIRDLVIARLDGALDIEIDPESDRIYWSETGKVLSYDPGSEKVYLLRSYEPEGAFTTNITAVSLDRVNNKLYWINAGDGKIERANPDGSGFEVVFSNNLLINSANSIAVDPDNERIYWSGIEYIRRVDYDGGTPEDVINEDIFQPEGIFIDQENDLLYWADLVGNVIKRANLDGSNAEDVYSDELENPADVVLNNDGSKLYVIDRGGFGDEGTILELNSDGTGKTETHTDLNAPVALTIDDSGNRLYWLDDSDPVIMERSGLDGSERDTLLSELSSFSNLTVSGSEEKIFWISSGNIYRADLDGGNMHKLGETNSAIDLNIDAENQMLYWTESDAIRRMDTDGTQVQDLVVSGVDNPDYLSLDTGNGKMYWVNGGFNSDRIKWANLDGSENMDLITGLNQPLDLIFNIRTGKIYWREGGSFSNLLKRANSDGSGIETLVDDGSGIQSYYVSEKSDRMFWSTRDIVSATSNGNNASEVVDEDWQSYSLSADPGEEKIYWFTKEDDLDVIKRSNYDGTSVEKIIEGLPGFTERKLVLYGDGITGRGKAESEFNNFNLDLYPNPTNNNASLKFEMPVEAMVNISLYDASGKKVDTIIEELKQKGTHHVIIGKEKLPGGIYFIRIQLENSVNFIKLIILK